ncbi:MAG: helix-turn-helix transcriptional regulator [Clostridia bacterium]|nr:helix-turn-helix transcriptional regulator [Clostridia bacterium]
MENNNEINQKIAKNLIYYRKAAGLTQAELAEKINYSDKSVSKWESGNGVPDVYTLVQLAELFGVTVNAFLDEDTPLQAKRKTAGLHLLVMLLTCGIVWLVAVCFFVAFHLLKPQGDWWLAYVYACVLTSVVVLVYGSIWKYRFVNFVATSCLIWLSLVATFLTARTISINLGNDYDGVWSVFLVGVPLQILEVLWVFFRSLFRKNKRREAEIQKSLEPLTTEHEE